MKADDIAGLTPLEIQAKYALPSLPIHVTDVIFKSGDELRSGIAKGLFDYLEGVFSLIQWESLSMEDHFHKENNDEKFKNKKFY